MVELLTKLVDFPISIPFRIKCKQIGKSFLIGPGYSIWKCNLNNVIIGNNVQIGSRAWIQTVPLVGQKKPTIEIRDNCSIGRNVVISAAKKIIIGKNCLVSYNASLLDHNHAFENTNLPPILQGIDEPEDIEIGEDCFLGAHSFILKGVVLGKHCIVGANSVVTSSFPPFPLLLGCLPKEFVIFKRVIRLRIEANQQSQRKFELELNFRPLLIAIIFFNAVAFIASWKFILENPHYNSIDDYWVKCSISNLLDCWKRCN